MPLPTDIASGGTTTGHKAAHDALHAQYNSFEGTTPATFITQALLDANSIIKADSDNTAVALTVPASTLVGRKATGGIAALTVSEVNTLLGTGAGSVNDASLSGTGLTFLPRYLTWTTVGQARPTWAGPVIWVGNYTTMGAPTNRVAGDHIIDTGA